MLKYWINFCMWFKKYYSIQWNSRLSSLTEPNQTWFCGIRTFLIFRCNLFEWLYMVYLMHLNDFYGFGSIELKSKKKRNIEKIRFGWIQFDSVRCSRNFTELNHRYFEIIFVKNKRNEALLNRLTELNNTYFLEEFHYNGHLSRMFFSNY